MSEPESRPTVTNRKERARGQRWEFVLADGGGQALLLAYSCMAVAIITWGAISPSSLEALMMGAEDGSAYLHQADKRHSLLRFVAVSLPFALALAAYSLLRRWRGQARLPSYWAPLVIAWIGVPVLSVTMFEYRHPVFTGLLLLGVALGAAHAAAGAVRTHELRLPDLSPRGAWFTLLVGWLLFTVWLGVMAHWRFVTFHAEPYDMSFETNAVHNIVHTGIPRISVGAGAFYRGQLLPANYADSHTPFIYYLFAPFYALYQDGRTLVWLQAAVMGSGAFGLYLFARRWLRSHLLGTLFGLAYILNPHVQTYCLHDFHANTFAIPMLLFALGMMEAKRPHWALAFAFLTAICREETGVYTAALGLFWALDRSYDPRRMRLGWITFFMGAAVLLFITQGIMVWSGGSPHYSRFTFYFDKPGMGAILKSYLLNPLGALKLMASPVRLESLWLSLLPLGFLSLFGWRAAWFLLIPLGLLFPGAARFFWVAGINYGAPIVAPVFILAVMGARRFLVPRRPTRLSLAARRAGIGAFVLAISLGSGLLYGNIFAKTYKLEFGSLPFRQSNQHEYFGLLGVFESLPPYGERERLSWELIDHVPEGVPIATSWRINPQLANRAVALLYPEDGSAHPPQNLAQYIVLDRLPPVTFAPEQWERKLRADHHFRVFYENKLGVIFERITRPQETGTRPDPG